MEKSENQKTEYKNTIQALAKKLSEESSLAKNKDSNLQKAQRTNIKELGKLLKKYPQKNAAKLAELKKKKR